MMVAVFTWTCEDPTTLSVSRAFSGNNLQTIFSDTFSVVTSTVQMDTFLTNGTGTVLLGSYHDDLLGKVTASSYFQVTPVGTFQPDYHSYFDSMVLVLNYNHTFTGDTTQLLKFNGYQLTQPMVIRPQPVGSLKLSAFNYGAGFFSSSSFTHASTPLFSGKTRIYPHTDSVSFRLPDKLGASWFSIAQRDSAHMFTYTGNFVNAFFYGLYLEADPATLSSVVGFDAKKLKIRIYYKKTVGDLLKRTFQDFTIYLPSTSSSSSSSTSNYQFNHIETDRSGTKLSSLKPGEALSSGITDNAAYLQSGTGLATRLDFPSLKSFFANQPSYILNAASLVVQPVQGTYPKNLLPPSQIQLFLTDQSNIPITGVSSGGTANISYDYEFGINTQYTFPIYQYIFGQVKSGTNFINPLLMVSSGSQGSNAKRLIVGDRFHKNTKIKLQILYSHVPN
jgi:hypothetical protein